MSTGGKYYKLEQYLRGCDKEQLQLSFAEIEAILGCPLSASSYQYQAYWANTCSYGPAPSWIRAGYHAEQLSLKNQTIVFRKSSSSDSGMVKPQRQISKAVRTPKMTAEKATELIRNYFRTTVDDPHGRYLSWQHCYAAFTENRGGTDERTVDYLALHLAFYLASWGMYRGSSFLLQKDYKVHIPVVQMILEPQYDCLVGISAEDLCKDQNIRRVIELGDRIHACYAAEKPSVVGVLNNATETLVTKIMMGTLGCVPAYDRYYVQAVKQYGVSSGNFNFKSVMDIAGFYCSHSEAFDKLRAELSEGRIEYPPMKLMDMCFWEAAYEEE